MASRYDAWQKFCAESDSQVSSFNSSPQKRCPFCGGEANMYWKYTDYDNFFIVECKSCEARIKTYSFDEAVKQWNRRDGNENSIALIKELADSLDGFKDAPCDRCWFTRCPGIEKCKETKGTIELVAKAREVVNG